MWSCVCESCSSSASLLLRSLISCSSRSSRSSARLTACFSWSLISRISSEWLLSMERMSSVKILSLSSTAVCAERCLDTQWFRLQWVWTETETSFSSSPDSPSETPPSLSASENLSLSAGFSAGTSSASPSADSAGQSDESEYHRKLLALNHHVNRWIQ